MSPQIDITETNALDAAITKLLSSMIEHGCETKEYAAMADQLTKLYKAKEIDNNLQLKAFEADLKSQELTANLRLKDLETLSKQIEINHPYRPSTDTLAIIAGNLVGIVFILGHERANVIASKALGLVMKLR